MVLNRSRCATGGLNAGELGRGAGAAVNGELSPGLSARLTEVVRSPENEYALISFDFGNNLESVE